MGDSMHCKWSDYLHSIVSRFSDPSGGKPSSLLGAKRALSGSAWFVARARPRLRCWLEGMACSGLDMVCNTKHVRSMTSASTTLQVRLPRALRESASSALEEMGLDLPTAVRLYLTKVAQTRRIPFPLEAEPVAEVVKVDRTTQTRMDRIAKSWKKAKNRR